MINPNKGKKLSIEHREKIKISHTGKKMSKEAILKAKNKKHPIICNETGEVFNNAGIAALVLFGSEKRYTRVEIAESARLGINFKNYTFRWLAK